MLWFALFAATVFALYFWREHRIQQRDLQSASAPHRVGERYIGQVLTLPSAIREGEGRAKLGGRRWQPARAGRAGRREGPRHRGGRQRPDRGSPADLTRSAAEHRPDPAATRRCPRDSMPRLVSDYLSQNI